MYSLFTQTNSPVGSVSIPAKFEWLQRSYLQQIDKAKVVYHRRVSTVPNQHLLVRLITQCLPSHDVPLEKFVDLVTARAPYVAKAMNLTSEISYGKMFKGVFYGGDVREYLVTVSEYVSPYGAEIAWRDIQAVEVLQHPLSDTQMNLPDGSGWSTAEGIAVIAIDIPKLLLQYRGFHKEYGGGEGELRLGVAHFVKMFVMPSLLGSHLEWVWLNILMNRYYGAPNSTVSKLPGFSVINYDRYLTEMADQILKRLTDSRQWYTHALQNIPGFYQTSMMEVLRMPDLAPTRQVWWLLFLTRLKVMRFLIDVAGVNGVRSNRGYIGQLQVALKRLLTSGMPPDVLTKDDAFDFELEAEALIRM